MRTVWGRTDPFPFCRKARPLLAQPEIPNLRIRDELIGLPWRNSGMRIALLIAKYGFRRRNGGSKMFRPAGWSRLLNTRE